MIKKIILLILIIIISIILAIIYGILNNQISYSISPEYFTKLKFHQFDFYYMGENQPRQTALLIGAMSTWWMGLIFGVANGLVGITHLTTKLVFKGVFGATLRIIFYTILFGILGVIIGYKTLPSLPIDWNIPSNFENRRNFLAAGTMHTLSYLGGIIGLIYGIKYQLKMKKANAQQRL